jgi:hypothetical protein
VLATEIAVGAISVRATSSHALGEAEHIDIRPCAKELWIWC